MISQTSKSLWSQENSSKQNTTIQAKPWSKSALQSATDFSSTWTKPSDYSSASLADPNTSYIFQGVEEENENADRDSFSSDKMRGSYVNARNPINRHNPRHGSLFSIRLQTSKTVLVAGLQSVTGTLDLSCSTSSKVKLGKIVVRVDGFEEILNVKGKTSTIRPFYSHTVILQGVETAPSEAVKPNTPGRNLASNIRRAWDVDCNKTNYSAYL
jgi:hypothetical protein